MKILKYKLEGEQVKIPAGSIPLHVRFQNSQFGEGIFLWCLVNLESTEEKLHDYTVISTGVDIPKEILENQVYFGTVEVEELILHVTIGKSMFTQEGV